MNMAAATKNVPFRLLRANRHFRTYWFARFISLFGDKLYFIALPLLVLKITGGSALSSTLTMMFETIPLLFTLPFLGVFIDQYDRKRLMMIADLGRGIIISVLFLLIYEGTVNTVHIYISAVLLSVFTQVFNVASQSYLPKIVEKENLMDANSKISALSSTLNIVGIAISGSLIFYLGAQSSILLNGISFFLSALLVIPLPAMKGNAGQKTLQDVVTQMKEGFQYLKQHENLLPLALFSASMNLGILAMYGLIFFASKEVLHLNEFQISVIFMVSGACALVSSLIIKKVSKKLNKSQLIRLGSLGVFIAAVTLSFNQSFITLTIAISLIMFVGTFVTLSIGTYRQEVVPSNLLGRVISSYHLLALGVQPIAYLGAGYIAGQFGIQTVYIISAIIVGTNMLYATFGKIKHIR